MIVLICLEIMSICFYVWMARVETKDTLKASKTYLSVAMSGSAVIWLGLLLLQDAVGTFRINELTEAVQIVWSEKSTQIYMAGFCMLIGLGAISGMFPFHFWLIKVHEVVSAPISTVLSGVLMPCGVVCVWSLTAKVFLHDVIWGTVLLTLGVITMVVGVVLAVFSVNLNRTLACFSVSQIGVIMVGVGMQCFLGEHNALAVRGTFLYMVNHSFMMPLLFNLAGVVYKNLHKLDLKEIQGFGREKAFLMIVFLIGAFGGIPIGNGYVSYTLLHESIVEYIAILQEAGVSSVIFQGIEWAFLISSGLTVAYMMKLFVCIFIEKHPSRQAEYDGKIDYISTFSKVVLGVVAVIFLIMGSLPNLTIDKMTDAVMEFMQSGNIEHEVQYFTWENLKWGFVSIGIGVVIYFAIIRTLFMKKKGAIDVSNILERIISSPKEYIYPWSDVSVIGVFFTWFFEKIIWVVGGICKVIDKMPERVFQYVVIGVGVSGKVLDILLDTITEILQKTVFAEMTEEKE